jgi:hypothetical protein
MGRRGVRLSSGFDVTEAGKRVTIALRPPGAWMLVERGAKPHDIAPKRRTTRAGHIRTAKRDRWTVQAASAAHPTRRVHHPGASGKRAITRAFGRMRTTVPKAFHDAQVAELRRIYG